MNTRALPPPRKPAVAKHEKLPDHPRRRKRSWRRRTKYFLPHWAAAGEPAILPRRCTRAASAATIRHSREQSSACNSIDPTTRSHLRSHGRAAQRKNLPHESPVWNRRKNLPRGKRDKTAWPHLAAADKQRWRATPRGRRVRHHKAKFFRSSFALMAPRRVPA